MAISALDQVFDLPYGSDVAFVEGCNDQLPHGVAVESLPPSWLPGAIRPIELLHVLGQCSATNIPARRNRVSALWAIVRYIDYFASQASGATHLTLEAWTNDTERYHRRAVLSEDLGIGVLGLVHRTSPYSGLPLLDIDAHGHLNGRLWNAGASRPDFATTTSESLSDAPTITAWEAKGRSDPQNLQSLCKTFAGGINQAHALAALGAASVVERLCVGAEVADGAIQLQGVRVTSDQGGSAKRGQAKRRPKGFLEPPTAADFAGVAFDQPLDVRPLPGADAVGSELEITVGDRSIVVRVGVEPSVLDAIRSTALDDSVPRVHWASDIDPSRVGRPLAVERMGADPRDSQSAPQVRIQSHDAAAGTYVQVEASEEFFE